jgi:hypothetical protein
MKTNLLALGHTVLFFVYCTVLIASIHYLAHVAAVDPGVIYAGLLMVGAGIVMFSVQKSRIQSAQRERKVAEPTGHLHRNDCA